jgi:xanthoxin dehydrogenase
MAGRLEGKVALVTGGASGIGEATIRLFAAEGARVVVADIQDERGEAIAQELADVAIYRHMNVTDETQVAAAIDAAVQEFGRIDCVYANAGIVGALGSIAELPSDEWDFTMAVNLRGVFLCIKHAARIMKEQRSGVILSTASVAGLHGGLGPHAYAAAKSAVIGLTRNVSAELAPFGVRVNCIAAGNMATEMVAGMVFGDPTKVGEVEQGLAATSPLPGRAGVPRDVARAALYLASEDAGFVTGHTLVVDAGVTIGTTAGNQGLYDGHAPLVREKGQRGLPNAS